MCARHVHKYVLWASLPINGENQISFSEYNVYDIMVGGGGGGAVEKVFLLPLF